MPKHGFSGVRIKIERAKRHVRELGAEISAFHARDPYRIIREIDPQSGDPICRVKVNEQVPAHLSAIIGDAICNLRAALDQMVCALVVANGRQLSRRTGFPIAGSAKKFEADAAGKIKGVSARADQLIRRLKPYKGGNEAFWTLHELARLDRHKSIIPGAAVHVSTTHRFVFDGIPSPPLVMDAGRRVPLKDGAVIYRMYIPGGPYSGIQDDPQFTFDIAFDKGQVIEGESVVPALQQLVDFVERVVDILERRAI